MRLWGVGHTRTFAWDWPEPLKRAVDIAIPFAYWHPATRQATDVVMTVYHSSKKVVNLDVSLYENGFSGSVQPMIKVALSVLSVAGLVFSHQLIRLPGTIAEVIYALSALTSRYTVDEFTRFAAAILDCLRAVMSLILKVCVITKITVAIAVFNVLIKLVWALQEMQDERWPEMIAHFTMAGLKAQQVPSL